MNTPSKLPILICVLLAALWGAAAHGSSTYVVDRLTDDRPASGGQGSGLAGDLRYAITNAQSGDSITFGSAGTINLATALPGLTRNISIQGPGANSLTVRGNGSNVFAVASGTTVVLSGLTITGGVGNGGGIFSEGTLTLNNSTVSGNVAGNPTNGGGTGPGIWNYINATLTLNSCTVSGNLAIGNLSYNSSRGGGIANYGILTLNNSTVSGNSAIQGFGGGISNSLGTSRLTLNNSTVSDNSGSGGGGIDNRGMLNARNAIIARNTGGDLQGNFTSQGHNLIGNTQGGSGYRPDLGDLLDVDPLLGPLQDNGGRTRTVAPAAGSSAIGNGDNIGAPAFDQRGPGFPRVVGGITDIGAFEVQPVETHPGTVPPPPLDMSKTGGQITLTWMASCSAGATDYGIYEGYLGSWYSHTTKVCNDAGLALTETFAPGSGNRYYLVVPRNGIEEGSYGRGSSGAERLVGATQCVAPQVLSVCP